MPITTKHALPLLAAAASLLLWSPPARAQVDGQCATEEATAAFREGFAAQQQRNSDAALMAYGRCLRADPDCVACNYEIGWTYWTRGSWDSTVAAWERTLELDPAHSDAKDWLVQAKDNKKRAKSPSSTSLRVPIGTGSSPSVAPVRLELVARFQNYRAEPSDPADHYDNDIYSPKSARFSADGGRVYVNSLEGFRTVVYDATKPEKIGTIRHRFGADDSALFGGLTTVFDYRFYKKHSSGDVNRFNGKPVESELSHDGRFLWIPYYRRDWDGGATSPSAVAVVDTQTDTIVRVLPTGPIPKYVEASPDGNHLAVVHWGDNTVGLIDTSSGDPAQFTYREQRLVVEKVLSQAGLAGEDRDKECGYCLRGTVFTPDSQTLLVSRMGGGGIAGFDVPTGAYLGTVLGMKPTPRHLAIGPSGTTLFLSSNVSGYVSKIGLAAVVDALRGAEGKRVKVEGWQAVYVGGGARTIDLAPDGRYIFAAVNKASEIVVIDSGTMEVIGRVRTDSYTVGLAVSPDGKQVWTTSQGREGAGGNSVCVYRVDYDEGAEPKTGAPKTGAPTP
jgi:DNA-binding beta-propeller fold protein YncE